MHHDAEALEDGSFLDADVTVVGAGPAGIVVALELDRAGLGVTLVESGHLRYSPAIQRLADTEHFDPRRHAPMSLCTRRQLGGASILWGGRCVPYDPVDFDERPWIPRSAWPVGYAELLPYFQRASDYFFCGRAVFDLDELPEIEQKSIVPGLPDGDVLTTKIERWSLPTNFGKEYAAALERSTRIRLVHGLTCTEIETDEAGRRVTGVVGRTLGGRTIRLRARATVLACGGLETTRLLLASDRRHPGGIGNHADLLGRFYAGHISGQIAHVRFSTDPRRTVYAFDRDSDGIYLRRRLSVSREAQHRERLTNVVAWLVNPRIWDPEHGNGVLSFAYLALSSPAGRYLASEAIRQAAAGVARRRATWPHVRNMLRDWRRTLAFIPSFGYQRYLRWRKVPGFFQYSATNTYPLHYHGEQVPNPASRVRLADETDALGLRKLAIDLRFSEQDVDGVIRAHRLWDAHLQRHGCGRLEYMTRDLAASVWEQATDGYHQCGTTRMSAEPAGGVVDPRCAVHGLDDLFVVSSSAFPTAGQANSTFMIIVFGLRLVEHLQRALGGAPAPPVGRDDSRGVARPA